MTRSTDWLAPSLPRPLLTLELSPPKGSNPSLVLKKAQGLIGLVDAINVPDCQRALLRMSAMVCAVQIQQTTGIPAIWQLTGRDRNLIALQADLLGGYALGLRSVLALTGDPVAVGDQATVAKQVSHVEAVALMKLIGQLNNQHDAVGKPFRHEGTGFTVGGALNPQGLASAAQQKRLCQKLEAGVSFLQTQPVYDRDSVFRTRDALQQAVAQVGCLAPKLLIGLVPPKSLQMANYLNTSVQGIGIPSSLMQALAGTEDPVSVSLGYCANLAAQVAEAADGFHLMPVSIEKQALRFTQEVRQALGLDSLCAGHVKDENVHQATDIPPLHVVTS